MFNSFLTALLYEMNHFLVKHEDFFTGKEADREKALESVRIPAPFRHYFTKVSEQDYLADMTLVLAYLQSPKDTNISKSGLFKALAEFFAGPFARKLDMLNSDYYVFEGKDQAKVVEQLIKSDTRMAQTLKDILLSKTYQQMSSAIQALCARVEGAPVIVVQTPREISSELKKEIRAHFHGQNPFYFPVFQINRKLIGGLRVFQDGETKDHSWLSRVLSLTR